MSEATAEPPKAAAADEALSPAGIIPVSDALAEAGIESLGELFSRDPEGYSKQDKAKIVSILREQRVRWAAAQNEPRGAKPRAKALGTKALVGSKSAEELGL